MKQLFLALLLINLTACSSMQSVSIYNLQNTGSEEVQNGDRVEVVTKAGEKFEFTVSEKTVDGLGGQFGFIPYQNMRRLRVHQPGSSGGNGTHWIWAAIGVAAAIALVAASDSVSVCSPGPCPPNENK